MLHFNTFQSETFFKIMQPVSAWTQFCLLKTTWRTWKLKMFHFTLEIKNALFAPEKNSFKPEITFYFSFCFSSQQKSHFRAHPNICVIFILHSNPSYFPAWPINQNFLCKNQPPGHTSAAAAEITPQNLLPYFRMEKQSSYTSIWLFCFGVTRNFTTLI